MPVRVGEILQLDILKRAHIPAGVRGAIREVQYIDVLERPDVVQIVKPNVLFLTSGYAIHDNEQLQKDIIERLHQVNAAGLGIQFGRYYRVLRVALLVLMYYRHY